MLINFFSIILLILAVKSDMSSSKINNKHIFIFITFGIFINCYEKGFDGISFSIRGVIFPILLFSIFFYYRFIGAGDIKLFSAIGALVGWEAGLNVIAYSMLIAGAFSVVVLIKKCELKSGFSEFLFEIKKRVLLGYSDDLQLHNKMHKIRLSPAIAIAVCIQLMLMGFGWTY